MAERKKRNEKESYGKKKIVVTENRWEEKVTWQRMEEGSRRMEIEEKDIEKTPGERRDGGWRVGRQKIYHWIDKGKKRREVNLALYQLIKRSRMVTEDGKIESRRQRVYRFIDKIRWIDEEGDVRRRS